MHSSPAYWRADDWPRWIRPPARLWRRYGAEHARDLAIGTVFAVAVFLVLFLTFLMIATHQLVTR